MDKIRISFLMKELNIDKETAIELINYDNHFVSPSNNNTVPIKKNKKTGIQNDELDKMKIILNEMFPDKQEFKNNNITSIMEEEIGINGRQTPSRLRKLVEQNFLEDLGGSPKKYKIK